MAAPVRLNALVVGSGWARHAAQAFGARADVRVRGVVGRGSARSFALARALGVPLFATLDEAIAETRPDLAVVAVGDDVNHVLASDLLRAGAHVLCAHPVAPHAADVEALASLARKQRLVVSTDYSFRTTPALDAARAALPKLGQLLRTEITFPGRFLPIALDVAAGLAGSVETVSAFGRYPDELEARRNATPAAFPPTVILEHVAGSVTALTPCPHANPATAIRATTSSTHGRLEVELPCGGLRRVRVRAHGKVEDVSLVDPVEHAEPSIAFGSAMRALADAFVDAVVTGSEPPCPLEDEVVVREVWDAIPLSMRTRAPVRLAPR